MRALITFAGLEQPTAQRLRIAVRLLTAHKIDATVAAWDGTRCDLLVACATDACGARAIDIAKRRQTPILAFNNESNSNLSAAGHNIDMDSHVMLVVESILELLKKSRAHNQTIVTLQEIALVKLAGDALNLNSDTLINFDSFKVFLSLTKGRVSSDSLHSIQTVMRKLGSRECSLTPVLAAPSMPFFISSDAFLLDAAVHCAAQLPLIEDKPWKLSDWPDLGSAKEKNQAMRVVNDLLRGASRPSLLSEKHNIPMERISSYLWAFKAAGLLQEQHSHTSDVKPMPTKTEIITKPNFQGLFAKLANRFGF